MIIFDKMLGAIHSGFMNITLIDLCVSKITDNLYTYGVLARSGYGHERFEVHAEIQRIGDVLDKLATRRARMAR